MILKRLEQKVLKSEGEVKNRQGLHIPYQDHLQVWTIGHGSTRLFSSKVTMHTKPITDAMAMIQFRHDLYFALLDASEFIKSFWTIGDVRREALVEMAYQLGGPKQRQFKLAQAAGNARDWPQMAMQMIDSNWYKQTPSRCLELAEMIETNKHPWKNRRTA